MATTTDLKFNVRLAYKKYYPLAQSCHMEQNYVICMPRGYILNLRIAVNNSETAKVTGVLFS